MGERTRQVAEKNSSQGPIEGRKGGSLQINMSRVKGLKEPFFSTGRLKKTRALDRISMVGEGDLRGRIEGSVA